LEIGASCELEPGVVLRPHGGSIRLGAHVHLGPGVVVYGHGGVEIGDDCLVAMHARILSSEHARPPCEVPIRSQPDLLKPTRLGRDVWLGAGVTVLGGVTVGDGCIVGAGAVVTNDLPSGSIAVGVPARIIGQRPSDKPPAAL
jgi:acetyltransferase-like isoleucine patch superfamily enzyme